MLGKHGKREWFWFLFLVWILVMMNEGLRGEEPPLKRPHIPAVKVNEPIKIDGLLDEAAWQKAAKVTGFWRTDRDELAKEQTEVLICYDEMAIYIAFLCHDSQPQLIRAQQKKRGGSFGNDDLVIVELDPLNRPRFGGEGLYWFYIRCSWRGGSEN